MRHAGTQTLETDRLFLRQLLPEDAEQMYTNWASDPEVTRFLRWEPHKNALETVGLLAAWATLYPNPDYYQWAIVEKASGQVFGSISIFNALLGDPAQKALWPQQDCTDGIWEAGYCIGKHWWNHGFATEALKAAVNYWFENTDGGWLTCCHAKENPASGRVMEKAGFLYHHDAGLWGLALLGHLCHGFHVVCFAQGGKLCKAALAVPQALIQRQQNDLRRGCFYQNIVKFAQSKSFLLYRSLVSR